MGRTRARTEMFSHWHGGSLHMEDQGRTTGGRIFVHSGTGFDTTGYGLTPDAPCATLNRAVVLATANAFDWIYLMPGHTETISTALLSPALSKAGLHVVGIGQGTLRPTFTMTHVDANIIFSAANCSLENVIVAAGIDNVVELIDINCTDSIVKNCELVSTAGFQATTSIDITGAGANAADRTQILDNKFTTSETAGAVEAIQISQVQDALIVKGNWISGDFSTSAIWSDQINTNLLIAENFIRNISAGDYAIQLTGASTGGCIDNRLYTNAIATALDPGSLMCLGNLWVGGIDMAAVTIPVLKTSAELGIAVTHTNVILGAGDTALFNIAGGYVKVLGIWGEVTTIVQVAATTTALMYTDTVGAVQYPLCATSDLSGDTVGTHVALAGGAVATVLTEGVAQLLSTPLILHTGHIDVAQGGAANTGAIDWTCYYVPIEVGATVTAA